MTRPFLNVPFLADHPAYVDFLRGCEGELDSLHFSLDRAQPLDNRIVELREEWQSMITGLSQLPAPKKYGLINSRFYSPELLLEPGRLRPLLRMLEHYLAHGVLDGLVYCDHYLLQALSDASPEITSQLEAVPGINTQLDARRKIAAQLDAIQTTHFKLPGKIILDREINRDLVQLAAISQYMRRYHPAIKLELLANEGCLPDCAFKLAHDAYIGYANISDRCDTHTLNRDLGCTRILRQEPYRILQSPFIRPEDVDTVLPLVDVLKLCGRTLGAEFLMRVIRAYRQRHYDGNLLDLLDAANWMSAYYFIDNQKLPADFAARLAGCDRHCAACGFCQELFARVARSRPLTITDLRISAAN